MRQIGPYQLLELLAKGGMGEVYLAEDIRLGRKVALKLLPAELTNDEPRVLRFQQEARTTSALNHPNIVTIFDIGEVESTHFIATEFVNGETLRGCMSASKMSVQRALNIIIQVASALGAAHEVGVVHRDIKPENIMVRTDGLVKVLDFGIAKLTQRIATSSEMGLLPLVNTEPGMLMGTPKYMSPEQMRGLDVDERTDIFSLGVVLYEMLTGTAPFEAATIGDIIVAILQNEPQPIAQDAQATGTTAGLQQIVAKALRKDRDERYRTMGDLISDLRGQAGNTGIDDQSILPMWSGDPTIVGKATELSKVATQEDLGDRGAGKRAARTTSSAEYIVSGIKQHKRSSALFLVALLAAVAAVIYFASGSGAINSVAVLPFDNASNDPNTEYLSDGISDSLINSLSRLPRLKVMSRNSSFKYRGKDIDLQEVAKALGVQAIVTGRIVQYGDTLQVSVGLVDTRDRTQMWGEQYNRKATDLLAVQSEISQRIAEKLRLRLTNAEQQQIVNDANANPKAYDLVLKGRFFGTDNTKEGLKKYVEFCNQAIAIDPNYAFAYAQLADAYRILSYKDPTAVPKAEEAALKALQLDDSFADAHCILAQLKGDAWVWAEAERENKRAIELNPSLADAHYGYALYLSGMERHQEAIAEMRLAKELDPLLPRVSVGEGVIFYNARQYDHAIEKYKKALEAFPTYVPAQEYLGYTYSMKGMYAEAIGAYKEALKHGDNPSAQCYLGYALAMSGQRNDALAILKQLESGRAGYVSPAELAVLYAGLGDKDRALDSLERDYAEHDLQLQYLKVEPHYDSLRSDPRFTDILRKVGLTP